jgi:hypothetical protein
VEDTDFARLKPGRIIRAGVLDMHGRNWKVRPVVILTSPAENAPDSELQVACGSTSEPTKENEPFAIRLPGHHSPAGHPRTGLHETTWFYAGWLRTVMLGEVDRLLKFFPESELLRLRQMISDVAGSESA